MLVVLALSATLASSPASCEALKSLTLPNTTIVAAEMVAAGPFVQPGRGTPVPLPAAIPEGRGRGGGLAARLWAAPRRSFPAHCRINAILRPSPDSEIEMEAWLPENWNGKFQFVGGGGWAGNISFPAMVSAVQEGYATASTDTGAQGRQRAVRHQPSRRRSSTSRIAPSTRRRCRPRRSSRSSTSVPRGCRTGTAARPADARA